LKKNVNSLLTRFYGHYSIKKGNSGNEISIVIMPNIFANIKVNEQYDLKGSTIDRLVTLEDNTSSATIALKDLNLKRKLYIGPERKAKLLEQLEKDCKWLESFNICDYSLLVGFYYSKNESADELEKMVSQNKFLSAKKDEIYFLGIIDQLTQFDFKKRSENTLKSIVHDSKQISAIGPSPYRIRFQAYISGIFE